MKTIYIIKHATLAILIFTSLYASGQKYNALNRVGSRDTVGSAHAVIYGNFIQRLGFSSGGFPQEIRLLNNETNELICFRVKATFKSSRQNEFAYFIPPGTYTILNYWWTKSKWYGGEVFTEPIFKGIDTSDKFEKRINSGQITRDDLIQFRFSVAAGTINYLGTWHFEKGLVAFANDKSEFDELVRGHYKGLDFTTANVVLPN